MTLFEINDHVASHGLINCDDGSCVRVRPPGERWPEQRVKDLLKHGWGAASARNHRPVEGFVLVWEKLPRCGEMRNEQLATREGIFQRITEIDRKFASTEPWLHSTLSKLAREREELVELSNNKFGTHLKHEWR
jgi:hypothetical protein